MTVSLDEPPLTLADWRRRYAQAGSTPRELLSPVLASLRDDDPAWILRCDAAFIEAQLARLEGADREALPLFGVPFAVKDNIDVAGLPTTAACPAFAYRAARHATVVQRLMDAGAVLVGKTNLDQFATGLVGTRSPYGEVPNSFDPAYVSGGSSSGSASVVARGLVPFALGTDTAGSGRVPAGFNNIVGLKPTPGAMPMTGVLPACRTLDVVSVFALTVADAALVTALIEGRQPCEPAFHRAEPRPAWLGRSQGPLRIGVPALPTVDQGIGYAECFDAALAQLRAWEVEVVPVEMAPLHVVAQLLYEGPWVAERQAAVRSLLDTAPQSMDPTVRQVIEAGRGQDAVTAFEGRYALETLRQQIAPMWDTIDALMVPTAPTCPTRAAVAEAPIARNSELGRYTNFVNLLGLAALALPSGFTPAGLPFGITFIAPGGSDAALARLGARWEAARGLPLGRMQRQPTGDDRAITRLPRAASTLQLAVVGAHLQGMPLHGQLVERGCRFVERTRTAPSYRLYALPETKPPKPGLARVADAGQAIEVEVYEMPSDQLGSFLALIPPPLGLGSVQLADGRWVHGFICEPLALAGAEDISAHGGWRAWLASRRTP
ncbi:allophanate hydrolase [Ideonella sp. YS5]|uniref:allophanate hydrolase n=1 Tax=Ideonella sp. YS5 TaxID=3453714 RepID=UPI003EEFBA1B